MLLITGELQVRQTSNHSYMVYRLPTSSLTADLSDTHMSERAPHESQIHTTLSYSVNFLSQFFICCASCLVSQSSLHHRPRLSVQGYVLNFTNVSTLAVSAEPDFLFRSPVRLLLSLLCLPCALTYLR